MIPPSRRAALPVPDRGLRAWPGHRETELAYPPRPVFFSDWDAHLAGQIVWGQKSARGTAEQQNLLQNLTCRPGFDRFPITRAVSMITAPLLYAEKTWPALLLASVYPCSSILAVKIDSLSNVCRSHESKQATEHVTECIDWGANPRWNSASWEWTASHTDMQANKIDILISLMYSLPSSSPNSPHLLSLSVPFLSCLSRFLVYHHPLILSLHLPPSLRLSLSLSCSLSPP